MTNRSNENDADEKIWPPSIPQGTPTNPVVKHSLFKHPLFAFFQGFASYVIVTLFFVFALVLFVFNLGKYVAPLWGQYPFQVIYTITGIWIFLSFFVYWRIRLRYQCPTNGMSVGIIFILILYAVVGKILSILGALSINSSV